MSSAARAAAVTAVLQASIVSTIATRPVRRWSRYAPSKRKATRQGPSATGGRAASVETNGGLHWCFDAEGVTD